MKRTYTLLFFTHFLTRFLFALFVGFYSNYTLQPDANWLVPLGDKVILGDFNFELTRFIVSPLYPILCGIFKILFSQYWNTALIFFQLIISAISGVYIFKIAQLIFDDLKVSLLSSLLFAFFPLTLWFVNSFSQECLFQSLLIFTVYFIIKSTQSAKMKDIMLSAVLFSLSYLTKSHILLFSLFIPIIFIGAFGFTKKAILFSFVFAAISFIFSIPYGLYQYKINSTYTISSNGSGYQFYLGNTDAGYKTVVDVPEKTSEDYSRMKNINETAGYFNGSQSHYDSLLSLPQKLKQALFFREGIDWIKNNPKKFWELKMYNLVAFLMPGVSYKHYEFWNWLFSFFISFPIYLLAYATMFKELKLHSKRSSVIYSLFLTMVLFSTVWYVQNRFRTITIEPFYIIYAAVGLLSIISKSPLLERNIKFLYRIFLPNSH